jgi:hypothetical protein
MGRMGFRVSRSWWMVTSVLVAFVVNCGETSSDEPGTDNATNTGGSSGSGTGGSNSSGREQTGGRAAEAGRPAMGGSATGGDSAGAGQAEGGETSTGGAGGTVATGGPYPLTLEGLFQAQCDAAVSCCDKKGLGAVPNRCAGEFGWGVIERKLKNGNVVLDTDALEACIEAYENAATTCTETGIALACRGLLAGTKAPGESCSDFEECDRRDGPAICQFTGNDPAGECTPLIHAEEGEPCEADCQIRTECSGNEGGVTIGPRVYCFEAEGLYCSYASGTAACRAISAIGEECENGTACGSEGRCKQTSSSSVEQSCVRGLELGKECRTLDRVACENELWCDGPSSADGVGVCREYEFHKAAVCDG